jgi:glycoprotein-N-acetylgalactosamine 3-beta-galactosyltransferase
MTRDNFFLVFSALVGFSIGLLFGFSFFTNLETSSNIKIANLRQKLSSLIRFEVQYDTSLADNLYNEVKILCMVMTYPANHDTKAVHVRRTWGRRCNKILFMTSANHSELETVVLDGDDNREELWNKTKKGFMHLYDHYLNYFDYFLKADDDK